MTDFTILGGGQQGLFVANNLAKDFSVRVIDMNSRPQGLPDNIQWDSIDELKSPNDIIDLAADLDESTVVVNALPSSVAPHITIPLLKNKLRIVDLSFTPYEYSSLNFLAAKNGSVIFHDCGFAPGLPDLLVGEELYLQHNQDLNVPFSLIKVYVGGIATDPLTNRFGYVNTWSLDDLYEEYTRSAHGRVEGMHMQWDPISSPRELVQVGEYLLEGFVSDGLRSLLYDTQHNNNLTLIERTLRWPGHLDQITPLLRNKEAFLSVFKEECSIGKDIVLMKVNIEGHRRTRYTLIVRPDPEKKNISSMARTTGTMCSEFARLMKSEKDPSPGAYSPYQLGLRGLLSQFRHAIEKESKYNEFRVEQYS